MLIRADAMILPFKDRVFDAVVTDPPYNLAFMGKEWDGVGTPREFQRWCETWGREVLRVVKPGAHMCCFGGTRTAHRLACGLEDAGWEIRDCLAWVYGGGFPKSLDVGKAIDRARYDGAEVLEVTQWIKAARKRAGLSNGDIDAAFGFNGMAGHWTSQASQPAVPTLDQVPKLLELLGVEPPERIRRLLLDANGFAGEPGPNWWKREKIGEDRNWGVSKASEGKKAYADFAGVWDITAPATEAAKQWDGWGSSLKPAHEPVILCKKPLPDTEYFDRMLAEIGCCLFSEEVICRKLNVSAKGAELLSLSILPLFVKAAESIAPDLAKTSSLAKIALARLAEKCSMLSDPELREASRRIAAGNAAIQHGEGLALKTAIGMADDSFAEMGELLSETDQHIGLSTASSWSAILADLWSQARTFTTETMTLATTDLKILKSLTMPSTSENITLAKKILRVGESLNVSAVDALLKNACLRLSSREETTARGHVSSTASSLDPRVEIEPIYLCRAPLSEPTIAANVLRWGTGALWIDGCRVDAAPSGKNPRPFGSKGKTYASDSWTVNAPDKPPYDGSKGRWPANLLLCHSHAEGEPCGEDCPVAMLDGQSGHLHARGNVTPTKRNRSNGLIPWKGGELGPIDGGDSGGASRYFKRFFYTGKASSKERMGAVHPTIKPVAVFRYLTRLICPPGGIVLDPFCGSGTIKLAAEPIARKAVGSDKAYQRDARKRTRQKTLWGI